MAVIRVQEDDFDVGAELSLLGKAGTEAGAIASFVGIVRSTPEHPIAALVLEHYPGMTERQIAAIAAQAEERFGLTACTIIHRVGRLEPGARIVLAAAAAAHRHATLDAVAYLMDWLKSRAPFWKQEVTYDGATRWVELREPDEEALSRW